MSRAEYIYLNLNLPSTAFLLPLYFPQCSAVDFGTDERTDRQTDGTKQFFNDWIILPCEIFTRFGGCTSLLARLDSQELRIKLREQNLTVHSNLLCLLLCFRGQLKYHILIDNGNALNRYCSPISY